MGFSQQEYWSGVPLPSPGDLPDPGIKPVSPETPALQVVSLPLASPGNTNASILFLQYMTPKHSPIWMSDVAGFSHDSIPSSLRSLLRCDLLGEDLLEHSEITVHFQ